MKKIRITNNHGDNRIVMIPGSRKPTRLPAYGQIEMTIPETVFQMVMEDRLTDSGILIDEIIPDIPAEPEPEQPIVSDEIVGPYPDIDPVVVNTPVVKTQPETEPEPAKVEEPKPVVKPATKKRGRKTK